MVRNSLQHPSSATSWGDEESIADNSARHPTAKSWGDDMSQRYCARHLPIAAATWGNDWRDDIDYEANRISQYSLAAQLDYVLDDANALSDLEEVISSGVTV